MNGADIQAPISRSDYLTGITGKKRLFGIYTFEIFGEILCRKTAQ